MEDGKNVITVEKRIKLIKNIEELEMKIFSKKLRRANDKKAVIEAVFRELVKLPEK